MDSLYFLQKDAIISELNIKNNLTLKEYKNYLKSFGDIKQIVMKRIDDKLCSFVVYYNISDVDQIFKMQREHPSIIIKRCFRKICSSFFSFQKCCDSECVNIHTFYQSNLIILTQENKEKEEIESITEQSYFDNNFLSDSVFKEIIENNDDIKILVELDLF